MTIRQAQVVHDLMSSMEIREAIEAAILEELNDLFGQMRQHVRSGNAVLAAQVEGQMTGLQKVSEILIRESKKNYVVAKATD